VAEGWRSAIPSAPGWPTPRRSASPAPASAIASQQLLSPAGGEVHLGATSRVREKHGKKIGIAFGAAETTGTAYAFGFMNGRFGGERGPAAVLESAANGLRPRASRAGNPTDWFADEPSADD
jgi:hypothetical protein